MKQMRALPWSLFAFVAIPLRAEAASPTVNVGMQASFPSGPYLLELLETAAGENSSCYFPLLDRIAEGAFADSSTEATLYKKFVDILSEDGHVKTAEALSTFNLALSLRSAAPRVEAHYQYYETAVENKPTEESCDLWISYHGKQYCNADTNFVAATTPEPPVEATDLPFDRTFGAGKDAILYGDPTSASFGKYHKILQEAAQAGKIKYRLRYRRRNGASTKALPVSGYGVELALKRTDYIVIDDREAGSSQQVPPPPKQANAEASLEQEDEENVADIRPLSTSELASLGMKAASFIQKSGKPFDTMIKLTQDFPRYSSIVSAHNVSDDFAKEYELAGAQRVPRGINVLWMNGVQLIERQIEPFSLIEMLRKERKLIEAFQGLGFTGSEAVALLGHKDVAEAKGDDTESIRYDWTDRLEGSGALLWLNDLEKDSRYAEFPTEVSSLLQRAYPGQLPPIAKNMFNIVVPVNLSEVVDLAFIEQLSNFIERRIPIRFGIVPITTDANSIERAKLAYHTVEYYGLAGLLSFLEATETMTIDAAFSHAIASNAVVIEKPAMEFSEVIAAAHYESQIQKAEQWLTRLKIKSLETPTFVNGALVPRTDSWLQALSMKVGEDLQMAQKAIFHEEVNDESWLPGIFLANAMERRNEYLSGQDSSLRILDVNQVSTQHSELFEQTPVFKSGPDTTKDTWGLLTVLADLTSLPGRELFLSALAFKRSSPGVQLNIIHNPTSSTNGAGFNIMKALKTQEQRLSDILSDQELEAIIPSPEPEAEGSVESKKYAVKLEQFLTSNKISSGSQIIILNGRLVGPIQPESPFAKEDFQQLLLLEQNARILPVYKALDDLELSERLGNALAAAKITSLTALSTVSDIPEGIFESAPTIRSTIYETWNFTHTTIEVGDVKTAKIHLVALLNPLSDQGQKWAHLLHVLSQLDGVYIKLFLNPKEKLTELPVKRFFRFVMDAKPSFDADGFVMSQQATFKNIPSEALLTAGMDVPPAWLVSPKSSIHDLDNIKLASIKADVDATYELEHILIQGHSRESSGTPPKGAQLVLGTNKDAHITDTIIMSNLGFFQFKANPGYYNIQLKQGRSEEIYSIESIGGQGWNPVPGDEGTSLALMDFQGTTVYPRLQRKEGKADEDVLQETSEGDPTLVSRGLKLAEGILGGFTKSKSLSAQKHADINIFSVASGHLYERMLNIMMVSVMRNTKQTVKFWFIEQFLSPSFKKFIPHLAKEYGFKYEMVTYKWPHWLRQQKEKQREIWGYKILFLDVLFPLSLEKVIFVDADQIVRTDMMDLVNLDLEGAPYGFTPMCDSRTEMEGFRFWKQGYWERYLRGNPYHISALYVVDLRRFRELAAGDRLRQQYHALSADPNSLANLDQDLPNHMQFQIPIFSLPQEWLWCETWCSDESQAQARTIDLCNNPQTKEPKLDRARRQVPEWTVYDDEIAALAKKVGEDKDNNVTINTKSRRFEETGHPKDEL